MVVVLISIMLFAFPAFAADKGVDFDDTNIDIEKIFDKLNLERIDEPSKRKGFSCFDISDQENLMLGYNNLSNDYLLVYSPAGEFLYGFSFIDNGNFGVEWEGTNINLYLSRSDLVITVDTQGNCVDIKKVKGTTENYNYLRNELYANEKTINGTTYLAKHWLYNNELLHWGKYQELVKIPSTNEHIVLYSCSGIMRYLLLCTFVVIMLLVVLAISICRKKQLIRK